MPRNSNEARYNTKVYKVHLSRDELRGILSDNELLSLEEVTAEEGGNFSSLETAAYRESRSVEEEEDSHSIDDPSYDFVEELSKVK